MFQPLKWFVTVSVYFVSVHQSNCFPSSPLSRRNTFLRTTLCLPCGPWFWLDHHWRATRCVPAFTFLTALCFVVHIWIRSFSESLTIISLCTGDRHDAESTVRLFETQIWGKVSSLWPYKFQALILRPSSFFLSLQLYRLVFICLLRLPKGVCSKFLWP